MLLWRPLPITWFYLGTGYLTEKRDASYSPYYTGTCEFHLMTRVNTRLMHLILLSQQTYRLLVLLEEMYKVNSKL